MRERRRTDRILRNLCVFIGENCALPKKIAINCVHVRGPYGSIRLFTISKAEKRRETLHKSEFETNATAAAAACYYYYYCYSQRGIYIHSYVAINKAVIREDKDKYKNSV